MPPKRPRRYFTELPRRRTCSSNGLGQSRLERI
jgi:hypothetical protein